MKHYATALLKSVVCILLILAMDHLFHPRNLIEFAATILADFVGILLFQYFLMRPSSKRDLVINVVSFAVGGLIVVFVQTALAPPQGPPSHINKWLTASFGVLFGILPLVCISQLIIVKIQKTKLKAS